ncbi:MAG: hypothetical protein AAGG07_03385 [Planctomycetota bacterium]
MNAVTLIVSVLAVYLAIGAVFAIAFVTRGLGRVDPAAGEGTRWFKLLILPGCAALWPLMLGAWARAKPGATQ